MVVSVVRVGLPTTERYSYVHWVLEDLSGFDAVKGFIGPCWLVAWVVFVARGAHLAG